MRTQAEKLKAQAKKLYHFRQEQCIMPDWRQRRAAFMRRVKRLAAKIDASLPDEQIGHAVMYLDSVALREGFDILFKNQL